MDHRFSSHTPRSMDGGTRKVDDVDHRAQLAIAQMLCRLRLAVSQPQYD